MVKRVIKGLFPTIFILGILCVGILGVASPNLLTDYNSKVVIAESTETEEVSEFWQPENEMSTYSSDWIEINEAKELAGISPGGKYYLIDDIDLSGKLWNPIDLGSGTFDGRGYSIIGLTQDDRCNGTGLFKSAKGGTIKNVALKSVNIKITSGDAYGLIQNGTDATIQRIAVDSGIIKTGSGKTYAIAHTDYKGKECYIDKDSNLSTADYSSYSTVVNHVGGIELSIERKVGYADGTLVDILDLENKDDFETTVTINNTINNSKIENFTEDSKTKKFTHNEKLIRGEATNVSFKPTYDNKCYIKQFNVYYVEDEDTSAGLTTLQKKPTSFNKELTPEIFKQEDGTEDFTANVLLSYGKGQKVDNKTLVFENKRQGKIVIEVIYDYSYVGITDVKFVEINPSFAQNNKYGLVLDTHTLDNNTIFYNLEAGRSLIVHDFKDNTEFSKLTSAEQNEFDAKLKEFTQQLAQLVYNQEKTIDLSILKMKGTNFDFENYSVMSLDEKEWQAAYYQINKQDWDWDDENKPDSRMELLTEEDRKDPEKAIYPVRFEAEDEDNSNKVKIKIPKYEHEYPEMDSLNKTLYIPISNKQVVNVSGKANLASTVNADKYFNGKGGGISTSICLERGRSNSLMPEAERDIKDNYNIHSGVRIKGIGGNSPDSYVTFTYNREIRETSLYTYKSDTIFLPTKKPTLYPQMEFIDYDIVINIKEDPQDYLNNGYKIQYSINDGGLKDTIKQNNTLIFKGLERVTIDDKVAIYLVRKTGTGDLSKILFGLDNVTITETGEKDKSCTVASGELIEQNARGKKVKINGRLAGGSNRIELDLTLWQKEDVIYKVYISDGKTLFNSQQIKTAMDSIVEVSGVFGTDGLGYYWSDDENYFYVHYYKGIDVTFTFECVDGFTFLGQPVFYSEKLTPGNYFANQKSPLTADVDSTLITNEYRYSNDKKKLEFIVKSDESSNTIVIPANIVKFNWQNYFVDTDEIVITDSDHLRAATSMKVNPPKEGFMLSGSKIGKEVKNLSIADTYSISVDLSPLDKTNGSAAKYTLKDVQVYYVDDGTPTLISNCATITGTGTNDQYTVNIALPQKEFFAKKLSTDGHFEVKYILEVNNYTLTLEIVGGTGVRDVKYKYGYTEKSISKTATESIPYGTTVDILKTLPKTVGSRQLVAYHGTYGRFPISSDRAGNNILDGGSKTINNNVTLYIQVYNLRNVSFSTLIAITSNTDQDVYDTNGKAITTGDIINFGGKKYKKLGDSYISSFGIKYDYKILTGAGNLDIPNKVVSEGGSLYFGYTIPSGYGTNFDFVGFYAKDGSPAKTSTKGSNYREFNVGSGTGNIEYYVAFTPKTYTVIYDNEVSGGKIKLVTGSATIPSTMPTQPTHKTISKDYSIGTKYTFKEEFKIEGFTLSYYWNTGGSPDMCYAGDTFTNLASAGESVTLEARWRKISYTIQYFNKDEKTVKESVRQDYWTYFDTSKSVSVGTGYNHTGWKSAKTGKKITNKTSVQSHYADENIIKLYPTYEAIKFNVKYVYDGKIILVKNITYGNKTPFLNQSQVNSIIPEGYTLNGWKAEKLSYISATDSFDYVNQNFALDSKNIDDVVSWKAGIDGGTLTLDAWISLNQYNFYVEINNFSKNVNGVGNDSSSPASSDKISKQLNYGSKQTVYFDYDEKIYERGGIYKDSSYTQEASVTVKKLSSGYYYFISEKMPVGGLSYYIRLVPKSYNITYIISGIPGVDIDINSHLGTDFTKYNIGEEKVLPTIDDIKNHPAILAAGKEFVFSASTWAWKHDGCGYHTGLTKLPTCATGNITLRGELVEATNYRVNNYVESLSTETPDKPYNEKNYTLKDTEILSGLAGSVVDFSTNEEYLNKYIGCTLTYAGSGTIASGGATVINNYYTRDDRILCLYKNVEEEEYYIHYEKIYGDKMSLPTLANSGDNIFLGWTDARDNLVVKYQGGEEFSFTSEKRITNLYALWGEASYTIVFDGNKADSGSMENLVVGVSASVKLTANNFVNNGYSFRGWSRTQNGSVDYSNGATVSKLAEKDGTITLYAVWEIEWPVYSGATLTETKPYDAQDADVTIELTNIANPNGFNFTFEFKKDGVTTTGEVIDRLSVGETCFLKCQLTGIKNVSDSGTYHLTPIMTDKKYNKSIELSLILSLTITPMPVDIKLENKEYDGNSDYIQEIFVEETGETVYAKSQYPNSNAGAILTNTEFTFYTDSACTQLIENYSVGNVSGSSAITKKKLRVEINKTVEYKPIAQTFTVNNQSVDGFTLNSITYQIQNRVPDPYEADDIIGFSKSVVKVINFEVAGHNKSNFDLILYGKITITQAESEKFNFDVVSVTANDLIYNGADQSANALSITIPDELKDLITYEVTYYYNDTNPKEAELISAHTYYAKVILRHKHYKQGALINLNVTIAPREVVVEMIKNFNKTFDGQTEYACEQSDVKITDKNTGEEIANVVTGYKFRDLSLIATYGNVNEGPTTVTFSCKGSNYTTKSSYNVTIGKADLKIKFVKDYKKTFDRDVLVLNYETDFTFSGYIGDDPTGATLTINVVDVEVYDLAEIDAEIITLSIDTSNYNLIFENCVAYITPVSVSQENFVDNKTYNGAEQPVSLQIQGENLEEGKEVWLKNETGAAGAIFGADESDYKVEYYILGESEPINYIPKNVGTYIYKITLSNNFVFTDNTSELEITFEIQPRVILHIATEELFAYHTGDIIEQTVTFNGTDTDNVGNLVPNHTVALTFKTVSGEVGEYKYSDRKIQINSIVFKNELGEDVTSNYSDPNNIFITLHIITLNIAELPKLEMQKVIYDGKSHEYNFEAFDKVISEYNAKHGTNIQITKQYQVKNADNTFEEISQSDVINAGSYIIKLTPNIEIENLEQFAYLTIAPREITVSLKEGKSFDRGYDNTTVINVDFEEYINVENVEDVVGYKFEDLKLTAEFASVFVTLDNFVKVSIDNDNYILLNNTLDGKVTQKEVRINLGYRTKYFDRLVENIAVDNSMTPDLIDGQNLEGYVIFNTVDAGPYTLSNDNLDITNISVGIYTENYTFTVYGSLEIKQAEIELSFDESELTKTYNGTAQAVKYSVNCNTCVVDTINDYSVTYNGSDASPVNAGTYKFKVASKTGNFVIKYNGKTDSYFEFDFVINRIKLNDLKIGDLLVEYANPITIAKQLASEANSDILGGHTFNLTITIETPEVKTYRLPIDIAQVQMQLSGSEVMNNYDVSEVNYLGTITVVSNTLPDGVHTPQDVTVTYDGEEHTISDEFEEAIAYFNSQSSDISYYINGEVVSNFKGFTDAGVYTYRVTSDINITVQATLTISPREIVLSVESGQDLNKTYDGTDTFNKLTTTYIKVGNVDDVKGYTFASLNLTANYKYATVMAGNEVIFGVSNKNYYLSTLTLPGEVVAKEITINLGNLEKTFDNQNYTIELTNDMASGWLVSGHTLTGSVTVNEVDVKIDENDNVTSYDLSAIELAKNYNIGEYTNNYSLVFTGTLLIKPAEIEVSYAETEFTKTYNALPQSPKITFVGTELFTTNHYTVTFDNDATAPTHYKEGGYEYKLAVTTRNFVFKHGGLLTTEIVKTFVIEKLVLTKVNIGDQLASKDSNEITLNIESFNIETLASMAHKLTLTISVSGEYAAYVLPNEKVTVKSFTIVDENKADISHDYSISYNALVGNVTYGEYLLPPSVVLLDEIYTFDGTTKTLTNLDRLLTKLETYGITTYDVKTYNNIDNNETDTRTYTNAGVYTFKVYLNAGSGYPEYLSATLTINKRQLFIVTSGDFDKIYDDSANVASDKLSNISVKTFNSLNESVNLEEVVANHNLELNAVYTSKNAGKTTLTIGLNEKVDGALSNYIFDEKTIDVTILEKTLTLKAESMPEFYYNESSYKADLINFTATGLVDGHTITNGEVTFADIINYNVTGYDISKQTNSVSGFEIKNSASESVLTSNYNIVFEGTVFVKKAQLKVVGHKLGENDLPENKVYDAKEYNAIATVEIAEGKGYISNTENALVVSYKFKDTFEVESSTETVRNAGTYIITFALNETLSQNYELISGTEKTLTIRKYSVNIDLNSEEIDQSIFTKQIGETEKAIQFSYFVKETEETIENITLSREIGETVGTYTVSLSEEYKNNNYNITLLNGENKFVITKVLKTLTVEISESDLFTKVYDGEVVPTFIKVTGLDYKTFVDGKEITTTLTFEKLVFNNNSANVGDYSLNTSESVILSEVYEYILVVACPNYKITQREISLEKASWDKDYDGTNGVNFDGVIVKDNTGTTIDTSSKYYPTLTGTYATSDAKEGCDIYISAGDNFKITGSYKGTIRKVYLTLVVESNQTSVYGEEIEINYNIFRGSESYDSVKEAIYNSGVRLVLAQDSKQAPYSSSMNVVVGSYDIMFDNYSLTYNLTNFNLTLTSQTYTITQRQLTVEGAISKIYKQNDSEINLNLLSLKNVVANDKIELSSLAFVEETVGTSVVKFTVTGNDAKNYVVSDRDDGEILNRVVALIFDYSWKDLIHASNMQNNNVNGINLNYGEDLSSITLPAPTHEGYEFKGWKLDEIMLDETFVIDETTWALDEEEKTAYAVWEIKSFKVTLEAYDDESSLGGNVTLKNDTFLYGSELDLYSKTGENYDNIEISLNEGYEFIAFIQYDLMIEKLEVLSDCVVYFDINEIARTLSLNAGDGVWNISYEEQQQLIIQGWTISEDVISKTIKYFDKVNLENLIPVKKGYQFTGWSDETFNSETEWKRVEDYTITATYVAKQFKLTLNTGLGEFTDIDEEVWTKVSEKEIYRFVTFDTPINTVIEPTIEGYTFLNWKNEENSYTTDELSKVVWKSDEDQTFTALFNENEYKLILGQDESVFKYDVTINSATENSNNLYADYTAKEIKVTTSSNISISATAKIGYIFDSWVVQDLEGNPVTDGVTITDNTIAIEMLNICKDIKVYATYTLADVTITIKTNNAHWGNVEVIDGEKTNIDNSEIKVVCKVESKLTIKIVANEGYELSVLEIPEELKRVNVENIYSISNYVTDFTINAIFKQSELSIVVKTESAEKGSLLCNGTTVDQYTFNVLTGDSITFGYNAVFGYEYDRVEFDTTSTNKGKFEELEKSITFSDFTASGTITVYFKNASFELTVKTLLFDADKAVKFTETSLGGTYTLKVNGEENVNGEYLFESKVEITAQAGYGYHFMSYSSNMNDFYTEFDLGNVVIDNENISFDLTRDATIYIVFEINSYTVVFDTDGNGNFVSGLVKYTQTYKHGEELDFDSITVIGNVGYQLEKWIQVIDDEKGEYIDVINPTPITTDKHFRAVFTNRPLSASIYAQLVADDKFTNSITDKELLESIEVVEDDEFMGYTDATFDADGKVVSPLVVNSKNSYSINLKLNIPKGYEFSHVEITIGGASFVIDENIITLSDFANDFSLIIFYKAISYDFQVEFVDENGDNISSAGFVSLLDSSEGAKLVETTNVTNLSVKHGGKVVFNLYALNGYYFQEKEISKINVASADVTDIENSPLTIYSQVRKFTVLPDYAGLDSNSVVKITVCLSRVIYELNFVYNYPMTSNSAPEYKAYIKYGETKIYDYSNLDGILTPPDMPLTYATHTFMAWAETNTGFGRQYYFDDNGDIYYYESGVRMNGWKGIIKEEFNGETTHTVTLYGVWKLITHEMKFKINSTHSVDGNLAKFESYENIRINGDVVTAVEKTHISVIAPTLKDSYVYKGYKVYATKTGVTLDEGEGTTFEFSMPDYDITIEYFVEVCVAIEADGEGQVSFTNHMFVKNDEEYYTPFDLNSAELKVFARSSLAYEVSHWVVNGEIIEETKDIFVIEYSADRQESTLTLKKLDKSYDIKAVFIGKNVEVKILEHEFGKIIKVNGGSLAYTNGEAWTLQRVGTRLNFTYESKYGYEFDELENYGAVQNIVISVDDRNGLVIIPKFKARKISFIVKAMEKLAQNDNAGYFMGAEGNQLTFTYGSEIRIEWSARQRYKFAGKVLFNGASVESENNVLLIDSLTDEILKLDSNVIEVYFEKLMWLERGKAHLDSGYIFAGSGTSRNPYVISSADQLSALAYLINIEKDARYTIAHYKLAMSISLVERFWVPIGTEENPFNGTFIFATYKVSNIFLDKYYHPTYHDGLFGVCGPNAKFVIEETRGFTVLLVFGSILLFIIILVTIYVIIRIKRKNRMAKYSETRLK